MTKRAFILYLLLFGLWEGAFRLFPHLVFVIASPSMILARMVSDWQSFLFHTKVTLKEMLQGFILAGALAVPMAILMEAFRALRGVLQPLFVTLQCVPLFALAPIIVILLNWSDEAIVVTTALMIFFPMTMSLYQGLLSTPQPLVDYFKLHRANLWSFYAKLKLPWAIPHFCSGLRVSAGIAGIGAIGGEWAGGQKGLGVLMLESRRGGDFEQSFAALFCLVIITLGFYGSIALLEKGFLTRMLRRSQIFCSLILFLGLSSCSSSEPQESRLLLDWFANPNHIPLFVGVEKGFFKEQGIPLQVMKVPDPTEVIPYVTSSRAEFVIYYLPSAIRVVDQGMITPIATYIDKPMLGFMCLKEANIREPKDLSGKRVGYGICNFGKVFLRTILKEKEVVDPILSDVHYSLIPALGTKKVEALFGGYDNIEGEYLRSLGVELTFLPLSAFDVPDHPEFIIVAKAGIDEARAEKFRAALKNSIAYAKAHPDEAFEIYARHNPDKGDKTLAWERRSWIITLPLFADDPTLDREKWAALKEWLSQRGML